MNIKLSNINYIYNQGLPNETYAVQDVSFQVCDGEFIALVGSTGSGKSTLVQMLNGLKIPTSGDIRYDGKNVGKDKKELQKLRCRIGLVFQYPEYQLFDETVIKDVSFGPKNKGLSQEEALEKAAKALFEVGLPEDSYNKSPFDLSGGEKRRAAIAGILAMEPEVLILDEPTAGLDPSGKTEILGLIRNYRNDHHAAVIMVTHNMDEAAEYADRIIVMKDGSIIMDGDPHEVFRNIDVIRDAGLDIPQAEELCLDLDIPGCITIEEAAEAVYQKYR